MEDTAKSHNVNAVCIRDVTQQQKNDIGAALKRLRDSYGGENVLTDASIFTGLSDPVISEIINNLPHMEDFQDLKSCNVFDTEIASRCWDIISEELDL